MNRRGFLSLLGAALAEPLVPKGTSFSFLGGIYRPTWTAIPTTWPLGRLTLTKAGQSITIRCKPGTLLMPWGPTSERETVITRVDEVLVNASAYVEGLDPQMNDPRLFVNRNGDYLIEDAKPVLEKSITVTCS